MAIPTDTGALVTAITGLISTVVASYYALASGLVQRQEKKDPDSLHRARYRSMEMEKEIYGEVVSPSLREYDKKNSWWAVEPIPTRSELRL